MTTKSLVHAAVMAIALLPACAQDAEETIAESRAAVTEPQGPPRIVLTSQIRPFAVTPDLVSDICLRALEEGAVEACDTKTSGQIMATLEGLAASANSLGLPNPWNDGFLGTQEYRMYTSVWMDVLCDAHDQVHLRDPFVHHTIDHGWTPLPARIRYEAGVGNTYFVKEDGGTGERSVTYTIKNNSQVAPLLGLFGQVGIPGSIVPWVWHELRWTVTCTKNGGKNAAKHEVAISASHFPSTEVFGGDGHQPLPKLTGATQSDLPEFLYGNAIAKQGLTTRFSYMQPLGGDYEDM